MHALLVDFPGIGEHRYIELAIAVEVANRHIRKGAGVAIRGVY